MTVRLSVLLAAFGALVAFAAFRADAASTPRPVQWPQPERRDAASTALAFFPIVNPGARITRLATAGPYAVATFRHGLIENRYDDGQLLLQRFGFGWQVIDLSVDPAFSTNDLLSHGIRFADARMLLGRVVSEAPGGHPCDSRGAACNADAGSARDVEAIRMMTRDRSNEAIGPVIVRSGYAIAGWHGNGGGEYIFGKRDGEWNVVRAGGGAYCLQDLEAMRIPVSIARNLLEGRYHCGLPQPQ